MYPPGYQLVEDENRLWSTIERHSFASMICADDAGRPISTLVPFIGRGRRLWMHLASANPQANLLADGRPVLCQFLGPHAYVSPSWYVEPSNVPTWNFVQVTVAGRLRELGATETRGLIEETVREHENRRLLPAALAEMTSTIDELIGGIRAFEVRVHRIEGRFKLSQNRSDEDRLGVIQALSAGSEAQRQVADLMLEERKPSGGSPTGTCSSLSPPVQARPNLTEAAATTITTYRDGPLLVRGPVRIEDQDGNEILVERRTVALCRCGKSRVRPLCDGTHKLIGFRAPSGRENDRSSSSSSGRAAPEKSGAESRGDPDWG